MDFLKTSKEEIDKALEEIKKEVPGGITGNLADLKAKLKEGKAGIAAIQENEKKLAAGRATLDSSKKQIEDGKRQLEEGIAEAEKGEADYAKSKDEIEKTRENFKKPEKN